VLVPDAEVTGQRLAAEVEALLADDERRAAMAAALATLARPAAAAAIVDLLEQHARG
jgi:UDP-N-acetylglucosamine:LPS N-acetylglucosamine transferase